MPELEQIAVSGSAPCPCGRTMQIDGRVSGGEDIYKDCECGHPWLLRCSRIFEREGKRYMNLEMRCAPDDGGDIIVTARSIRHEIP